MESKVEISGLWRAISFMSCCDDKKIGVEILEKSN